MCTPRYIFTVRHAERIDDVDGKRKVWHYNSHFAKDNPPLSPRGLNQALELREATIPIDYCFSSPYERCIQTAADILEGRPHVKINVEPGLIESLSLIYDKSGIRQLNYQNSKELSQRYATSLGFNLINTDYRPVYLAPLEEEASKGVHGCFSRVEDTFRRIVDKCEGDILIVSHQGPLAKIQNILIGGPMEFGGIATVSKFCELPGLHGRFEADYLYDSSHLSDPTKLMGKDTNRRKL